MSTATITPIPFKTWSTRADVVMTARRSTKPWARRIVAQLEAEQARRLKEAA